MGNVVNRSDNDSGSDDPRAARNIHSVIIAASTRQETNMNTGLTRGHRAPASKSKRRYTAPARTAPGTESAIPKSSISTSRLTRLNLVEELAWILVWPSLFHILDFGTPVRREDKTSSADIPRQWTKSGFSVADEVRLCFYAASWKLTTILLPSAASAV